MPPKSNTKYIDDYNLYRDIGYYNDTAIDNYPRTITKDEIKRKYHDFILPLETCRTLKMLGYDYKSYLYYNTYVLNKDGYNIKYIPSLISNSELREEEYVIPIWNEIDYLNILYQYPEELLLHAKTQTNRGY